MSRALTSLGIVIAGCFGIMHWLVTSKLLWLGVGFPLVAVGIAYGGASPADALEALSRWLLDRARDLRIIGQMLGEAPAEFRHRRSSFHAQADRLPLISEVCE